MIVSQKIEIDPTEKQKKELNKCFGYSRYIWNKALERWNMLYIQYKNKEIENIPSQITLRNILKKEKEEWEKEFSPIILDTACENLGKAFGRFFKKVSKYPKFKSKKSAKLSVRFYRKSRYSFRIENDKKLQISGFGGRYGLIKMKEKIRFKFDIDELKQLIITKKGDKYFASFIFDLSYNPYSPINNKEFVGVDVGIKTFAVISDKTDTFVSESIIKKLEPMYEQIGKIQTSLHRKNKSKREKNREKDSNRYIKARTKLQKIYMRISNIQQNHVHEVTSFLCKNYKYICIEDLKPSNLLKNRKLSKLIGRSLFYEFRRQLEYKAKFYGNTIIVADKFFPSSQICSHCGNVLTGDEKLSLKQRTYRCIDCGAVIDRDINASINLRDYGMRQISCNKQ